MFKKTLKTENEVGLTLLRVVLGVVMFPHGAQKLLGWFGGYGFEGTMGFFTGQMGIPWIFAFLAIIAEFFGSVGLITGFLTRLSAFGIASIMVVAIFTTHLQNGFFMNWFGAQKGEGFEYHLLVLGMALVLILRGGGAKSVDRILSEKS